MKNSEIWYDLKGYEGIYQFSSLNRLKALSRKVFTFSSEKTTQERIKKPSVSHTYPAYMLSKNGRQRIVSVEAIKKLIIER